MEWVKNAFKYLRLNTVIEDSWFITFLGLFNIYSRPHFQGLPVMKSWLNDPEKQQDSSTTIHNSFLNFELTSSTLKSFKYKFKDFSKPF